jgi:deoxyadenosine/deoxycytidine kinase
MTTRKIKHIAIAGNIGAGKTTLTTELCKRFGWVPQFENTENNPYLEDFYHDMNRWSFNLQVFFLHSRYKQILEIRNGDQIIMQDRTIYEDANIFAPNLSEMGLMQTRDFESYMELFNTMTSQIDPPDLLIYLKASVTTLLDHILKRGRDYEGNMSIDYLRNLNERYDNWIKSYNIGPLLIINCDEIDFAENQEDMGKVISMIQANLHGLF